MHGFPPGGSDLTPCNGGLYINMTANVRATIFYLYFLDRICGAMPSLADLIAERGSTLNLGASFAPPP